MLNAEIQKRVICGTFCINNSANYTFQISKFRKIHLPYLYMYL